MQNLEMFLNPVDGLQPSGKNLTYSVEFDAIKDFRSADDPTLEQGEWQTDLKTANWPEVVKRCSKLLQEDTKDLRLVAWLTEGWVHTKGFSGLAMGYSLFARMCMQYWDSLYPEAEEGDDEQRMGSLAWMLNQTAQWVAAVPVVAGQGGTYNLTDFAAAQMRSGGRRLGEAQVLTLEQFEEARLTTPIDFHRELWEGIGAAMKALEELRTSIDKVAGDQAPSFAAAADALSGAFTMIDRIAKQAGVEVTAETDLAPQQQAPEGAESVPRARSAGVGEITSRQEALVMLRKIADYFREAEPHSPAAYLADQAAKWGGMSLHEWLPLVLRDEGALARLEEVLGVPSSKGT